MGKNKALLSLVTADLIFLTAKHLVVEDRPLGPVRTRANVTYTGVTSFVFGRGFCARALGLLVVEFQMLQTLCQC